MNDERRKLSARRSSPVYRGRGPRSGDGVPKTLHMVKLLTSHSSLALHPLTTYVVPSPYKQGESAIRNAKKTR